ncbi:pyruvate dehydrogenase E2 component (dihydrolipoamide acetyltransferase) [Pseudomonas koreensis]|uniref:dihydrolipoyllysine-residue acetyltransferase n=1 Tax=Pseudomonas koreensis TaxID=198620 RepID=UPI00087B59A6|nr:dihydrolipoyllysine-residue acetyltransferase [Pseudomonas koreensis]KAB0510236.1 dihydrolipoyllysine-residue acetyltransferase [Pseudomonas koreensis]NNA62979.1 dihydrolipoyllysine-residue acetyltransferase [Pseudomonas koreensis]GGK22007.1 acetyltransferase component of pyruvate dehydrogenase complex [Pseudomonas koreensis]SDD26410.1 pyruvate dehydrogenase E2 component (dihydrolipoamide acetyltransferase) [Pseudomonas koreensis]
MSELIRVPDIGSGEGEVIELFVKAGDRIEADQSILTLESDKASMEVPAPKAGVIKSLKVKLGDRLKEGDELLELEVEGAAQAAPAPAAAPAKAEEKPAAAPAAAAPAAAPAAASVQQVHVPDIGSSGKAQIIEIQVKVGDTVEADQSLITLESDKASMEIPSPAAGVVKAISVKLNDEVGTGDLILDLEVAGAVAPAAAPAQAAAPAAAAAPAPAAAPAAPVADSVQDIHVPDIGSAGKAKIIEVLVKAGDSVEADQSLITLESDKASMEIPSPAAGVVESISIKLDDEVGTGDLILKLKVKGAAPAAAPAPAAAAAPSAPAPAAAAPAAAPAAAAPAAAPAKPGAKVHAGPAVRQLAREFGVELSAVGASGPHGRILKEDVQVYVKAMMQKAKEAPAAGGATGGAGIPPIPVVDFSRFGEIEEVPMTRLMQVGAANLHRSWLNVPHVTQFDSADITELEAFRVAQKAVAEKAGVKLTILPLLLKTCAHLLKELPDFNSSLAPSGKAIIRKKYVNIGFAVDTPDGLLVPVIKNVDQKSLLQLAAEAASLAEKARTKKLSSDEMQGACFTISSLGHIGGTGFTPIVNAPEVAILGVSKATIQPVWDGKAFQPKLMLPLSLSYDHRVINGAAAARFTQRLGSLLGDIRTILL